MKRNQFIEYINYPNRLNEQSLNELTKLVEDYPYFQAARMLLVKNLHLLDDIGYNNELKITAAHINDRKKLFFLINEFDFLSKNVEFEKEIQIIEKPEKLTPLLQPDNSLEYEKGNVNYDLGKATISLPEPELKPKIDSLSLIENFLAKQNAEKIKIVGNEKSKNEDFSLPSLQETDDLMTETLANILIKQKNYSKAKNIFERLCLIYPEKSIYFAARIKELDQM
ncbi:MAG: hypothetical protein FWH18_00820 [Marinilabiliaceae bacterium]|nr:hypothetical protein [Marinilabiliaceae bacterium]